jgi:hypothetical protein
METSLKAFTAPKQRLVYGVLLERSEQPVSYDLRVHQLNHGHIESVVMPRYAWLEADMDLQVNQDKLMASQYLWDKKKGDWGLPHSPPTEQEKLDRAARNAPFNRERSAKRARTKVRRLCKHKGLTTMLTLTYRENMGDRERMARDFDVFVKRVRRAIGSFEYVCVFERQKRGALHAHIAVPKVLARYMHQGQLVKSYDLFRACWRGVVGADNGTVNVMRSPRLNRSSAKLACYLAKYIAKGFEEAAGAGDSYRASGRALPDALVINCNSDKLSEAMLALFELLQPEVQGSREMHHAVLDCGGYFLALSP